jgi:hypothetical protein
VVKDLDFLNNKSLNTTWDYKPSAPGVYQLYAEYYDWGGTARKSNKISVTVQ